MSLSSSSSDSTLEIAPPSTLELLWINHRGVLLGSIAGVAVAALIVLGLIASAHATRLASETLLSQAGDETGWRAVIAKYPHSPAAADAMLLLAAALREEGKTSESDGLYSRFAESFPSSTLVISGLLGRAANERLSGQPDQAINSYQQAAAAFPQSYGAPFALFSEVQLLAQQGKSDEAKRVLQTLATQYQGSASAQNFGGGQQ